jgi:Uma2 family endonuclease
MAVAAMPTTRRVMTKEEFKQLPEGPPYYEFEYGEVIEVARPHPFHNIIVGCLFAFLYNFVRERNLGLVFQDSEVDLTPDLTYAPDILFIRQDRVSIYHPDSGEIVGVPDLIVEVISSQGARRDRVTKFRAYLAVGVEWLWLIDPEELTIEEYHLQNGHYVALGRIAAGEVFRPALFPELEINLQALVGTSASSPTSSSP